MAATAGIRNGPLPGLTDDQVDELRQRTGDRRPESITAAARAMGISRATAHRYLAGAPGLPAWVAACMEPEEWASWRDTNDRLQGKGKASRPCADCTLGFAAEMRAQARCNGTPAGAEHDEIQEEAMTAELIAREAPTVTRRVQVAGELPCLTCTHAVVCGLRAGLEAIKVVEVILPRLPAVQNVQVAVSATCEYHEAVKGGRARQAAAAGQRKARTYLTDDQVVDARRRIDAGETVAALADALGVHHTTLRERLAKAG